MWSCGWPRQRKFGGKGIAERLISALSACVRKMALPDLRAAPESLIRAVLPPLLPIRPSLLSIFDAGLVADAGREKRASRSGCKDEQERSCDPLSGNRREGVFHTT